MKRGPGTAPSGTESDGCGHRLRSCSLPARALVDDALRWLGNTPDDKRQGRAHALEGRQYVRWWLAKSGFESCGGRRARNWAGVRRGRYVSRSTGERKAGNGGPGRARTGIRARTRARGGVTVPHPPERLLSRRNLVAEALNQLSEREGECRDASGEHDKSECRDAPRNQLEPSRSESPSQSE